MNYKYSDITSKVILVLLVIFYVWIGFQWDENAPKRKRLTRSNTQTESEKEDTKPEKPENYASKSALMFRTDNYISGFGGTVSINGKAFSENSDNSISFQSSKTITTERDSWLTQEFNGGFILVLPQSTIQISDKTIDVKSGIVMLSGTIPQKTIKAKGIPINIGKKMGNSSYSPSENTEITIITERNKVRVFCLNDEVSFKAFGKNYTLSSGIGASLFFDAKKVNQYDLGEYIMARQESKGLFSWDEKNVPIRYNVIFKGVDATNPNQAEIVRKLVQTQSLSVTENSIQSIEDPKVFSENRFFTWSRSR